ncbi:MAG: hypothetical protein ACK4TC_05580 [Sphingomonas pseudosanguinis]|uniref:hypothetical protein n=1 Tax=Sphingomonas pseudosanguinis TaxID=413712 RepID=UPI00391B3F3C
MSYLDMVTFDGPNGTVAISPDAATVVWKRGEASEVRLITGVLVPLNIDAGDVAKALWGFRSETDDGFFNDAHVIAIVPNGGGSRFILEGNMHLDNPMPVNQTIMSQRNLQAVRAKIRAEEQE